jgi:AcrR family transcriptional regulator
MDELDRRSPPSLADEQQQLTRSRIRRAAREVVAKQGFDATVDEIARVSGVSPRTIFRHYLNHEKLIVATVKDIFEACGRGPVEGLPRSTEDPDGWLEGLAVTIHTRNAEIVGEAFWDIHASNHDASETLSEVAGIRREFRRRGINYLAARAWRAVGGIGEPPEDLVLAFALNFSAFTTQALMVDFDQTPAQIGALTAEILKVILWRAVEAQSSAGRSAADTNIAES